MKKRNENELVNFIKQLRSLWENTNSKQGKFMLAYYDWFLKEGEVFDNIVIEKNRGRMKQCYYNSQMKAIENSKIKYYEGYALSRFNIPLEHGFNVSNDKVREKTWSEGRLYYGINIPTEFISKHWLESSMAETLLGIYFLEETKQTIGDLTND